MTDHRVFVRPHLVIEILLSGEEFQCAGLSAGEAFVGARREPSRTPE